MKRLALALAVATTVVTPSAALAATAVPVGTVNLRAGPGLEFSVVAVMSEGERAQVLGRQGNWIRVRTRAGLVGFMADWVTREVYDDELYFAQVMTDVLNLREGPGLEAPVRGKLLMGERLRALESLGGWIRLDAGWRGTGWVSREYVMRSPAPPATSPPIQTPPEKVEPIVDRLGLRKAMVAANRTSVHASRDARSARLAEVMAGDGLTYLGSADGWVRVATSAGVKGWVEGSQVYLWDDAVDFSLQAAYAVRPGDWHIQYLRLREVTADGSGLRLRSGPTVESEVKRVLVAGERMKLLAVPGGEFVQVMLAGGETGWVSRNWIRPVAGVPTESLRLTRPAPGVLRLELTGHTGRATVRAGANALELSLPRVAGRRAALTVGLREVDDLSLTSGAATLRFDQPFWHMVTEQADGRTVVEIRQRIDKVEAVGTAVQPQYRFYTAGFGLPEITRSGSEVTLRLPGAVLGPGVQGATGLQLRAEEGGVTARVATSRPPVLRTGPGYFDLVLQAPGLREKTIVVDPGHGGSETGAVGATGLREKDANLRISLELKRLLEAAGARVVLTRSGDVRCITPEQTIGVPAEEHLRLDLKCRTDLANRSAADAYISVHGNGHPNGRERGTETYWTRENINTERSQELAGAIQQELVGALGTQDRGVKEEVFYVIKYADAPAALAEVAFVSTPADEALLRDPAFQANAAQGLYRALERFFR